jgi:peptide chain release factor 1
MIEKIQKIKERYDELTQKIADPQIIANNKEWQKLIKERNSIEEIALIYDQAKKVQNDLESAKTAIKQETDPEMIELFKEEIDCLIEQQKQIDEQIKILLLPKDENDENNVIMEIRPAAGGDEAALFARELMNMYIRFAERHRWAVEISDLNETELGGLKEASFIIKGKGAYSRLKFESGVHRVQRVPETEAQGRIHTSTCTVAVLPEIEEVDFEILDKDLRVDTYRSSGAGGQHVNKTESAIRLTHLPTGIVVACQDERSQIKNREKAMRILTAKLYDYYREQVDSEYKQNRKNQVGTGDRSERIRTYNFPQGRITDHRINFSVFNMTEFLDGDLDEMIDELLAADRKIKLENAMLD